jgi:hypothetical protein
MNQPETLTAAAAAARHIATCELAPTELLDACLEQIRDRDVEVAAWSLIDEDGARATARERDSEARAGRVRRPLHGVPLGVEDVIDVAGMTTTGGAAAFAHTEPTVDATCVARLRAASAVIVGKNTTTELAYKAAMKRYSPKSDPDDTFVMYGWTSAATMVDGMKEPMRAALMDSVRNLDSDIGTLLPGNRVKTGPGGAYPVEGLQIQRFAGRDWEFVWDLVETGA